MGAALLVRGHGIHQSAVHLSDLEGRVGDALGLVRLVDLDQLQSACPLVVEGELLALGPFFNENALGRSIQDILLAWDPDLFCGNGGSGGEARQQDLSIPVRHILTLVGAERHTAGIGHQEGDPLQRLVFSALDILLDGQIHARDVVHGKRLRICGIYRDHLPLCSGINGESGQAPGFLDHDGSHNRNTNLATLIGRVEAQGGQVPIGVIHKLAGCVAQFELHPSQRLGSELVQFFDDEIPGRLIDKAERLSAFAALDLDALGGGVQHHAVRDLEFLCGNGDAWLQIGDDDTSVLPRDVFAVAAANDRPGAVGHEEGDSLQRDVSGFGFQVLFNGQRGLGDVLHVHMVAAAIAVPGGASSANGPVPSGNNAVAGAVADNDRPGRRIEDIAGRHPGFHNNDRGIGDEARHRHGPIGPCGVAANEVAIAVPQSKFRVGYRFPADRVPFRDSQCAEGFVVYRDRLGVRRIDCDGLNPGGFVNDVPRTGGQLLCDHSSHHRHPNLPGVVGLEPALAGQMPKVVIHKAAVRVGQFKLYICQGLLRNFVQFPNHKVSRLLVVEAEDVRPVIADLDGFRRSIQHYAVRDLDLPRGDGGPRLQTGDHHTSILAGDVLAVAVADYGPAAVRDQEGHALQGLVLAALLLDVLFNDKRILGSIVKIGVLNIVRIDNDGLAPGIGIDGIAGDRSLLGDDHRPHDAIDGNGPVRPGVVDAVGGHLAVFIIHHAAGGVGHLELYPGQGRLAVQTAVLVDHQGPQGLIAELQRYRLPGLDLRRLGRIIQQIPRF